MVEESTSLVDIVTSAPASEVTQALAASRTDDIANLRYGHFNNGLAHAAVRNPDASVIRLVQDAGANIDLQDGQGRTPLHHAIDADAAAAARMLLALGARRNLTNSAGLTADGFCRALLEELPSHETCRILNPR
ncbi:ankyrin repeat domain-containing protein [Primorskyibacter sp. S187A]|uniref:ankyrin repeat domain-containing protein n=1 Tax=Primorskyibacter sp. S187A TaxID=3415130 RepID=UPI003C7BADDC